MQPLQPLQRNVCVGVLLSLGTIIIVFKVDYTLYSTSEADHPGFLY